jgi:AcrR family transcriptional regulator
MHEQPNSSARILDAALTLFSERGYEAASTREICELAGITKPTLYYFYRSKEGIYRALIRSAMDEFRARVEKGLRSSGSLRQRLKTVAELAFLDANRRPRIVRLLFATVYSFTSPFPAEVHKPYRAISRKFTAALTAAVKAGEIRGGDTDVRVLVLMGAVGEAISNSLLLGTPKLTRKLAHSIVDTVLDGWPPAKAKV